jgi:CubicO group peptidase (beta-lactamase class C family)
MYMNRPMQYCCSLLFATVVTGTVFAQCTNSQPAQTKISDPQYVRQIQAARQAALEIYDHGFLGNSSSAINNKLGRPPGFSVAVAVDGKLVWAEGFGFADLEQCVLVTPQTKFRIGSTSKPLTAAGAALLSEQGRLDLDAPIQKYVPTFPDKGYVITTRQLLGHLGGIRDYNAKESATLDRDVYPSVTESLKRFKDDPLIAPPGAKWRYTTYGYVLASAAMEGASGQDFLSFMHDKVFLPLGMQDTVADESAKIILNRAHWYSHLADGSFRNTPYEDLSYKWAGGGFLSTAEDLVRFGSAMLKPGFLKQETLAMVFSRQKAADGAATKYGLGWELHDAGDGQTERRFEHSGGVAGSSSWLVIYPDQKVAIAWLENCNDFRDWPIARVAEPFFTKPRK